MKYIQSLFFSNTVINEDFLVFFRIVTGIIILSVFLSIHNDFEMLFGENAVIPTDIHRVYTNGYFIGYNEIIIFLNKLTASNALSTIIFEALYIILGVCIVIGFFSRPSAVVLLFLHISLMKSFNHFFYGIDFFLSISLMYIVLFPSDSFFSIRKLIFKKEYKNDLTPFRRLFQIHICYAYFISGFLKLVGHNWRNGEAVWKTFHLPNYQSLLDVNIDFLGRYPILFVMLGWLVIIIELGYPIFINLKKTRNIWLLLTIIMHLNIALILGLYFFSALMITWNITNYYYQDQ